MTKYEPGFHEDMIKIHAADLLDVPAPSKLKYTFDPESRTITVYAPAGAVRLPRRSRKPRRKKKARSRAQKPRKRPVRETFEDDPPKREGFF